MIMIHDVTNYSFTEQSRPVWLTGDQYSQLLSTDAKETMLSRFLQLLRRK